MQRFFEHRTTFDGIKRIAVFQAAMKLFDQRTFARAHWSHQIKHLAALFAFQRCGVKIAHDLRNGFFDAKELIGKKIVKFYDSSL